MAISYPQNLPTSVGISRVRFVHLHSTALLRSPWSYQTQTQENPGKLLAAEVTVALARRDKAAPWIAFLGKLKGPVGTFYLGDPSAKTPQGVATGTPLIRSTVPARDDELFTKGWTTSTTGILKAGDWLQVGTRLYQVLEDVNSDGLGNCNVPIFPTVREEIATDTPIVTNSPKGLFRLDGSEITTHEVDAERLYQISFSAVEAI